MPKSSAHTLTWSAENHYYILHTPDHPPQPIQAGDEEAWQAWLHAHSSFAFWGQSGHLNVFKELRARGTGYWYGYQSYAGRMKKRYLGRAAALTLAYLEEIAQSLQGPVDGTTLRLSHAVRRAQKDKAESLNLTQPENVPLLPTVVTRLAPHSLPTTLVVRERLLAALDAALTRPLTLISASAGWGKTTLLAAWVHRSPYPIAWL
ncbi:hypothetical protein [Tengunoibacter tsumagoiensis]|uniref:Uncharacterized protein n=1 Tax=Tengunoibacter tsumagoiensis TaxID=2014871 RepID=A0A402A8Q5_9CHLR|nr:hypothetical protein [Tengunoibacter tsumagoiensis]GCE15478.1 hypothetical protein KTT_53370 [Tengunoibacter tsumagoiensis]